MPDIDPRFGNPATVCPARCPRKSCGRGVPRRRPRGEPQPPVRSSNGLAIGEPFDRSRRQGGKEACRRATASAGGGLDDQSRRCNCGGPRRTAISPCPGWRPRNRHGPKGTWRRPRPAHRRRRSSRCDPRSPAGGTRCALHRGPSRPGSTARSLSDWPSDTSRSELAGFSGRLRFAIPAGRLGRGRRSREAVGAYTAPCLVASERGRWHVSPPLGLPLRSAAGPSSARQAVRRWPHLSGPAPLSIARFAQILKVPRLERRSSCSRQSFP